VKFLSKNVKISEVDIGDFVLACNIKTQTDVYRSVLNTMRPVVESHDQVEIIAENGATLVTSTTHPTAINDGSEIKYVKGGDITTDDYVVSIQNKKIKVRTVNKPNVNTQYADFSIDEHENYYAGRDPNNLLLAHNSATLYYPIWHLEVEDLLVLKNNKGTEDNRIRHMDYGVQFNKLMYERLLGGGNITLFSPSDVPGLYDAFFADTDQFTKLYEAAEANPAIRKKTIKAADLFSQFAQERKDTGRIYLQNVDHANSHSPFKSDIAPIRQSNLCAEIDLPTKPLNEVNDPDGEIALCTLSAINWGMILDPADFAKPCELAVRGLDALLTYQHYPVPAAKNSTDLYRPLGIGIINFAYWLAKNGYTYTNSTCLPAVDEYMEAMSYYLIKTSITLAQEFGPCAGWQNLKYADGVLPVDTRKSDVDDLVPYTERMPWDLLRNQVVKTGIRNATLMALMPSETSSQVSNSTNGIEPVRSLITTKQSKHGVLKQVVPEFRKLKNKYELLWNQRSPEGYLRICAVLQKWVDQGISVNTSYNPRFYAEEKIPMSEMLKHILMFYKLGGKQLYYNQTNDNQGEINMDKITDPVDACDSCVL